MSIFYALGIYVTKFKQLRCIVSALSVYLVEFKQTDAIFVQAIALETTW